MENTIWRPLEQLVEVRPQVQLRQRRPLWRQYRTTFCIMFGIFMFSSIIVFSVKESIPPYTCTQSAICISRPIVCTILIFFLSAISLCGLVVLSNKIDNH